MGEDTTRRCSLALTQWARPPNSFGEPSLYSWGLLIVTPSQLSGMAKTAHERTRWWNCRNTPLKDEDQASHRYRLSERTREFAESVSKQEQRQTIRRRHAEYYRQMLYTAWSKLQEGDEGMAAGLAQ
jgi:hypothetical protein